MLISRENQIQLQNVLAQTQTNKEYRYIGNLIGREVTVRPNVVMTCFPQKFSSFTR